MTTTLPTNNIENITRFDHAVFYCMNQSSERIPVAVVRNVSLVADNILEFSLSHFPVLENMWNVFAGELYFYKKGISFNMNIHGTAWFTNSDDLTVQFKVLYVESAGFPEVREYSLQDTLAGFFSNTSLFFKKMIVTGF
jgi:hypothetical protein